MANARSRKSLATSAGHSFAATKRSRRFSARLAPLGLVGARARAR